MLLNVTAHSKGLALLSSARVQANYPALYLVSATVNTASMKKVVLKTVEESERESDSYEKL